MCCTLTNFNLSGEKDDFHKSIKIEYLAAEYRPHRIGISQRKPSPNADSVEPDLRLA